MEISTRNICNKGDFVDVQVDEIQFTLTSGKEVLDFANHLRHIAKKLVEDLGLDEGKGWYCINCERAIYDTDVTFEETHQECGGDCV